MALEVIGAGLPRTGTKSMKGALEQLGFGPCHHASELLANPYLGPLWGAVLDGKPDWDAIFKNYRSTADAPACMFYRKLAAYYPDAKVISACVIPSAGRPR